jgi:HPt (histidine-containing phosphotransfer) domain-containing protein
MAQWFRKIETPEPPVLDDGYLDRLAKHIGPAQVRELLADGLLELTDRLDRLREQAAREEIEEIGKLCHDIAGAAGHLGLSRLSHAAVEGCRLSRGEDPPAAAAIIADIEAARAESLAAANRFCTDCGSDHALGDG